MTHTGKCNETKGIGRSSLLQVIGGVKRLESEEGSMCDDDLTGFPMDLFCC
jgi:hypothetical protein